MIRLFGTRYPVHIPFYKVYTPFDFRSEADFIASSAVTGVAVFYNTGGVTNGRILRFPLIPPNVLQNGADIVAVITVGLGVAGSNRGSDPQFYLSDGITGLGFQKQEESTGNRCLGRQATMGNVLRSISPIRGATHISTSLSDEHVLTIKPQQFWGSCYNSADRGLIYPVRYTRTLSTSRGLWLEVYRESTSDRYAFNYIKVEIHEN